MSAKKKSFETGLEELGGKNVGASNEEHSLVMVQLLTDAAEKFAKNDVGNGNMALTRAMAVSAVLWDKAQAESWTTEEHKALAARCDAQVDAILGGTVETFQAYTYYASHRPFPMVLTKAQAKKALTLPKAQAPTAKA